MILVSPDGRDSRKLPSPVMPSNQGSVLVWSRNSATIYIASSLSGEARLDAVDVQSGKAKNIGRYKSDINFQSSITMGLSGYLSADGKSFVTSVRNTRSDLWILEGFPNPASIR